MGGIEVTLDKQILLTAEYWRSFVLSDEEIEHFHDLIVEEGIPQTTAFIAYELVEQRCGTEMERVEREQVQLYCPRAAFEIGQRVKTQSHGIGQVTRITEGKSTHWGQYQTIWLKPESGGKPLAFISAVERGFEDYVPVETTSEVGEGWGLDRPEPYTAPGEIFERVQDILLPQLREQLERSGQFVCFGEDWFLADLCTEISQTQLKLTERRLRRLGEPAQLHQIADLAEVPQQAAEIPLAFSWHYALAQDPRFDNVGTFEMPLWFLLELEPPEVVTKPERLAIPAVPYTREYEYIHKACIPHF